METFIAVCLGLITLEIGLILVAVAIMAVRMQKAARAVEVLAYRVEDEVQNFGSTLRSGWMKAIQAGVGLVTGLWRSRSEEHVARH